MHKTSLFLARIFCAALLLSSLMFAADWRLIGPEGGDVRSLQYDPSDANHVLLGTSAGQLFSSQDGGNSWTPFAHLGAGDDYVLDHIIFNPAHPATVYVAGWSLYNGDEGDVFRSDDGGQTWRALQAVHNKSVRAMAMSVSDPNTLVIGALDGVFRSRDGGETWERISPENHAEIKNIESIAIDPQNPDIIYAGTWHLPWKTDDGGKNWHSISKGIAFDSDMFSIIVDPHNPEVVYASACSGMYKSLNRAEYFHRIYLSLPTAAHRTRVLKQDPQRPNTVYAGTVAGLWKTLDGGDRWKLVTDGEVIVNDILVDPANPDHVLVATDRGGVLASNDGFAHYATSNRGFAHRVIGAVITDRKDPNRLYVGVVNDKDLGGFFISDDGGQSWRQSNRGLDERDLLSLQQADSGVILAGTNHGIFSLDSLNGEWKPATMIRGKLPEWREKEPEPAPKTKTGRPLHNASLKRQAAAAAAHKKAPVEPAIPLEKTPRVRSIAVGEKEWYAATDEGLFISADEGKHWYGEPVEGENDLIAVNNFGGTLALVSPRRAFLSQDQGKTWTEMTMPPYVTGVYNLTLAPEQVLWMATREGALRSADGGKTWEHVLGGLPARHVFAVNYDPAGQRLLATALHAHGVFESKDGGHTWQSTPDSAVSIRAAMNYQGHLLAASAYNGLLLEQGGGIGSGTASFRDSEAVVKESRQ
jgi:photosystem II stability/assembly factor-like uncharacterized protein